jgi:hypothetical protein
MQWLIGLQNKLPKINDSFKYYMQDAISKLCCFIVLLLCIESSFALNNNFKLQLGDLLFQDSNCGKFCDSINSATIGCDKTFVSHVAMVVKTNPDTIIEATLSGVKETSLNSFLEQSVDKNNHPRVMVGRLLPKYKALIPAAIKYAESQIGKPYNQTFVANNGQSFYCSELIERAFYYAGDKQTVFPLRPMNFNDLYTGKPSVIWQQYFEALNESIPQNKLGTNPGMMSRESFVSIVYKYGELRTK